MVALQLIVNNDENANQDSSSFDNELKALYLHLIWDYLNGNIGKYLHFCNHCEHSSSVNYIYCVCEKEKWLNGNFICLNLSSSPQDNIYYHWQT